MVCVESLRCPQEVEPGAGRRRPEQVGLKYNENAETISIEQRFPLIFLFFSHHNVYFLLQATSYGFEKKTEKARVRPAEPTINVFDPKVVIFLAKRFDYHFRDGFLPEMEPHFRSTSRPKLAIAVASSPVSTHRWRQQALRCDENSSSSTYKPHLSAKQAKQQVYCCLQRHAIHPHVSQAPPRSGCNGVGHESL